MSEFLRRLRDRVDVLEKDVRLAEQALDRLRDVVRERLVAGYDTARCMEEVHGRQCSRTSPRLNEGLGYIVGFCPQHHSPIWLDLQDRTRELEVAKEVLRAARAANQTREDAKPGGVYVIGPVGGRVKIGKTTDVRTRLSALNIGSPEKLELIAWIPHDRPWELEAELHKRFADARLHGEWFARMPEVEAWLEELEDQT